MPRPATPNNCHKPAKYAEGDKIWYLRHGKWRRATVTKSDGTTDGAKRWLVTDSEGNQENHAIEDDMRKEDAK